MILEARKNGKNFPPFRFSLSKIAPKIGSFTASHTRAMRNITPTATAVIPISVKYNCK